MGNSDDGPRSLAAVVANLHPASFAVVMATGIVSIASWLRGFEAIAQALLWLNVVIWAVLWGLVLARLIGFRKQLVADLLDHGRCVGFFTLVAGTCVLGNQFLIVVSQPGIALGLWIFGIVLWVLTTYGVLAILTAKREKPTLAQGLNGGWLVMVVAAQSVASLGGLLAPHLEEGGDAALFFSLAMWLGGGMLYIWIIAMIFYRYTFFALDPRQLAPPYWINMGAMAISTLAGVILAENSTDSALLREMRPYIVGQTLLFWATATWWIPLLIVLGVWRHILRRVSIAYDVVYWSAVFPLGMYTACTHRLARLVDVPGLDVIARYAMFVAFAAWIATFAGMLRRFPTRVMDEATSPLEITRSTPTRSD
jgi:tellurite resistance protein TehA-like permease